MIDDSTKLGAAIAKTIPPKKAKRLEPKISSQTKKSISSTVALVTELAVIAFLGGLLGAYLNAHSIKDDCGTVNMSKAGDVYIQCTIVTPKKDDPSVPPR